MPAETRSPFASTGYSGAGHRCRPWASAPPRPRRSRTSCPCACAGGRAPTRPRSRSNGVVGHAAACCRAPPVDPRRTARSSPAPHHHLDQTITPVVALRGRVAAGRSHRSRPARRCANPTGRRRCPVRSLSIVDADHRHVLGRHVPRCPSFPSPPIATSASTCRGPRTSGAPDRPLLVVRVGAGETQDRPAAMRILHGRRRELHDIVPVHHPAPALAEPELTRARRSPCARPHVDRRVQAGRVPAGRDDADSVVTRRALSGRTGVKSRGRAVENLIVRPRSIGSGSVILNASIDSMSQAAAGYLGSVVGAEIVVPTSDATELAPALAGMSVVLAAWGLRRGGRSPSPGRPDRGGRTRVPVMVGTLFVNPRRQALRLDVAG